MIDTHSVIGVKTRIKIVTLSAVLGSNGSDIYLNYFWEGAEIAILPESHEAQDYHWMGRWEGVMPRGSFYDP